MKRLGIFVGENQWTFFREICADLQQHFDATVFSRRFVNVPWAANRINAALYFRDLKSMLRSNDACFFEWSTDLLMHASKCPRSCAVITRLHSFELYEWAPQVDWDGVDRIVMVSHAMRDRFAELYPAHAHKTVVVYNGRALDAFHPEGRGPFRFHIGMACNIVPIKRVYEAVLSLHALSKSGHDARLFIAGSPAGEYRYAVAVERLVDMLGLRDVVTLEGKVDDMPAWFRKIDIFLSNSFWEGQQVALLEAMASGCYCLSHHWAGAEEMLPASNLFLTDEEQRQRIVEFASMTEAVRQQRQAELRHLACDRFDVRDTIAGIRRVIDDAIAARS